MELAKIPICWVITYPASVSPVRQSFLCQKSMCNSRTWECSVRAITVFLKALISNIFWEEEMSTNISKSFLTTQYPKLPLSLGIDSKYVTNKVEGRNKDYGQKKVNFQWADKV